MVTTDAGPAFLKALGNPEGPHALACEWVGTRLARWFGLRTFDHAIVELTAANEIPINGGEAQPGPAFVTRMEPGRPWRGDVGDLDRLMNKGDLTRLIYFDTWIRNRDRYSVKAGTVRRNRDNVFFSERDAPPKRYHLVAMDHTHCFANGAVLDRGLERIELIQDEDVYGAFPEFQKYTDYLEGADCRKRLRDVTIDIVGPYLDELPAAWDVGADVRVALGNFLIRRAQFLAEREISHILK